MKKLHASSILVGLSYLFLIIPTVPLIPLFADPWRFEQAAIPLFILSSCLSMAAWWGCYVTFGMISKRFQLPGLPRWQLIATPGLITCFFLWLALLFAIGDLATYKSEALDPARRPVLVFQRHPLLEAMIAAAGKVKEPALFKGWSGRPTGSWVKFRTVVEQPGLKIDVEFTQTLLEISEDKGVVGHKTHFRTGAGSWEENGTEEILRDKENHPITIEKEGDEELEVAGRKLTCHWIQGTRGGDVTTTIKIWLSDEIPGGVAKSETSGGDHDPVMKTHAVAWGKK